MYKDKTKERDNRRDNMKRYRQRKAITGVTGCDKNLTTKASKEKLVLTSKGMTEGATRIQGVTEGGRQDQAVARVEAQRRDIPEFARVLPALTMGRVQAVLQERARLGLFDDSAKRWERAVTWYDWDKRGRPVGG